MPGTIESASFLANDPDVLVEASLACPRCLSATIDAGLELDGYDPYAERLCPACREERRVFLTPLQALRLSLG